ncbi:hypothetical protein FS749_011298 [Ceratobasidium sp. UAMH 11750]|nr:hypothetical protein FS749_011298 [Ceratobasidium sp. UAMH 11750]
MFTHLTRPSELQLPDLARGGLQDGNPLDSTWRHTVHPIPRLQRVVRQARSAPCSGPARLLPRSPNARPCSPSEQPGAGTSPREGVLGQDLGQTVAEHDTLGPRHPYHPKTLPLETTPVPKRHPSLVLRPLETPPAPLGALFRGGLRASFPNLSRGRSDVPV